MFNGWVKGSPQRRLPSAAAITTRGSSKNLSSMVILNACSVANELCWFKKKMANTNLKTWIKPKRAQVHLGKLWVGGGLVGDGADKGGLYSKWFILQMTGSLESLPSSTAAPAQRGQIKGKEERWDTVMGHAGSEAAAWVCSNKPPSFFVVFQVQRSSWSPILGRWSLGGDGQSL